MVGRNFWAQKTSEGWVVREEGLPEETQSHASEADAWAAAKARAAERKGEAFLAEEDGAIRDRAYFGDLPRDMKI